MFKRKKPEDLHDRLEIRINPYVKKDAIKYAKENGIKNMSVLVRIALIRLMHEAQDQRNFPRINYKKGTIIHIETLPEIFGWEMENIYTQKG